MIWPIQAFWLLLAVPGFALLWRFDRASLGNGSLSGVARSYLASFVLLTPASVLGHVLHWPLWTLSVAYTLCVAAGLLSLADDPSWLRMPRLPSVAAALGGTLLLTDLVLGARAGTHVGGDAGYHIARIRLLMDLGLNSWDPLVSELRIDAVYHTNLYHALIASSAQLTGNEPGSAWIEVWPFAKLLTAAAGYQLAVVVFGRRWLGWLAATSVLVWNAAYSVLPFPNTLAPVALLPMGFAAGIEAICDKPSYRPAFWLAASALALAQVHALNAAFLVIVVAPCLALAWLYRALRRRPGKKPLALAVIALGASLPWLIVPALPHIQAIVAGAKASSVAHLTAAISGESSPAETTPVDTVISRKTLKADRLTRRENGLYAMEPERLVGPAQRNVPGLLALLFALIFSRRKQLWMFGGFLAMTCAWLTVPVLCTTLLSALGAAWAVLRLTGVFPIALCTLIPAAGCVIFDAPRRQRVVRHVTELAGIALAVLYAQGTGQHHGPWSEDAYLTAAEDLQSQTRATAIRARTNFFTSSVPPGATVMAHVTWDYNLPMHMRAHTLALAAGSGWHGVGNMPERRAETDEFFRRDTTGERRLEILRKYSVHHIYTSRRQAMAMVNSLGTERVTKYNASPQGVLLTVEY